VQIPPVAAGASHVYHQYTIRVSDGRDRFVQALAEEHKVASRVYYPTPVHRLASFGRTLDLPETELAVREVISLPVHPALSPEDLEAIAHAVNSVTKAGS
jgi:dTDP-4-amino-4,6-dideoxygalactose transaminase